MSRIRQTCLILVVLCATLAIAPVVTAAENPNVDNDDWDLVYENESDTDNNPDTELNRSFIQYNETTDSVIFRVELDDNDPWKKTNATGFLIDSDNDDSTGLSTDTKSSDYYDNLDNIGAEYQVAFGGSSNANETYKWEGGDAQWNTDYKNSLKDITTDGSNVTVEVERSTIGVAENGEFRTKLVYFNDSGTRTDPSTYDWAPDPENQGSDSIRFELGSGFVDDTEVSGTVTFNNTGDPVDVDENSEKINFTVRLTGEDGSTQNFSFENDPVFDSPTDGDKASFSFKPLEEGNYNGDIPANLSIIKEGSGTSSFENGSLTFGFPDTSPDKGSASADYYGIDLDEGDKISRDFEVKFKPVETEMELRTNTSTLSPGEVANISIFVNPKDASVGTANASVIFPKDQLSYVTGSLVDNSSFLSEDDRDVNPDAGHLRINVSGVETSDSGTMANFELKAEKTFDPDNLPAVKLNESLVAGEASTRINVTSGEVKNAPVNFTTKITSPSETAEETVNPRDETFYLSVSADPGGHNISTIDSEFRFDDTQINVTNVDSSDSIIANVSDDGTVNLEKETYGDGSFDYFLNTDETPTTRGTNESGLVANVTFEVVPDTEELDYDPSGTDELIEYNATKVLTAPSNTVNNKGVDLEEDSDQDRITVDQPISKVSIDEEETEIQTLVNMVNGRILVDVRATSANNGKFDEVILYNDSDTLPEGKIASETFDGSAGNDWTPTLEHDPDSYTLEDTFNTSADNPLVDPDYNTTNFTIVLKGDSDEPEGMAPADRYDQTETYNITDQKILREGDVSGANQTVAGDPSKGEVTLADALTALAYLGAESDDKTTPWQEDELDEVPGAGPEDYARVDIDNDRVIDVEDIRKIETLI